MSIMMYMLRHIKYSSRCALKPKQLEIIIRTSSSDKKTVSSRLAEFRKKLVENPIPDNKPSLREITPIKKLIQKNAEQVQEYRYPAWPNDVNPHTGEIGGPRGPEPTRYGDWERKGRCCDF